MWVTASFFDIGIEYLLNYKCVIWMRKTGLEPARGNPHKNLNLARLPFRHFRSNNCYSTFFKVGCQLKNLIKSWKNPNGIWKEYQRNSLWEKHNFRIDIFGIFVLVYQSAVDTVWVRSRGGIGIRARLRIKWALRSCGFKSRRLHYG